MTAIVFSIEEFSAFDGAGLRTSVFFKGCPLRCEWCHNPEGQRFGKEYVKAKNGCIGCGACLKAAVRANGRTEYTKKSAAACLKGLIRVCGADYTPARLAEKLNKNAEILSGGGITFSGGEPLCQTDFIVETVSLLDPRLNVALQTSGYAPEETFKKSLGACDFVLYDLKIADRAGFKKYCGGDAEIVLSNYFALAKSGVPFVTRVPLIPAVTDTPENLGSIAKIIARAGATRAELLPYNRFAGGKYASLGRKYSPSFDESAPPSPHTEIFEKYGVKAVVL